MKIGIDEGRPGGDMTAVAIVLSKQEYDALVDNAARFEYLLEECRDWYCEHDRRDGFPVQLVFPEPGVSAKGWRERLVAQIDKQRNA